MYSVLLVDDEIWSLEGIRKLFDWEGLGFKVTAQVTDALEAFELIVSTKPDVVFTDIRMPDISGIELLGRTRKAGIGSEFVIVSGFGEFEYAQEALRCGAFDYRLKPIDPQEAGLLLGKLKRQLDEKAEQKRSAGANLTKELIAGSVSPSDFLQARGFLPQGCCWQVVMIAGKGAACGPPSLPPSVRHLAVEAGEARTMLIVNGDRPYDEELFPLMDGWARERGANVGFSAPAEGEGNLGRLVREAGMAAAHPFIDARAGAVRFTAAASAALDNAIRRTERLLLARNEEELGPLIGGLPDLFREERLGVYHAVSLWNRIAAMLGGRAERGPAAASDFLDCEELVGRFGTLASLCAAIADTLAGICRPAETSARHTGYNDQFIALLDHVNRNYVKELSLSELADKYYLNMSYCSELFKKATGYTFRHYVTKLRMETAAELMRSGEYSVDRVSDMTGYSDYYYFCKMFKKFYGITPSQFAAK